MEHYFNFKPQYFNYFPPHSLNCYGGIFSYSTPEMSMAISIQWRHQGNCFVLMTVTAAVAPTTEDKYGITSLLKQPTIDDHSQPCFYHHRCHCNYTQSAAFQSNATLLSPNPMTLQIRLLLEIYSLSPTVPRINCPFQTFASSLPSILPILNTYVDISKWYDKYTLGSMEKQKLNKKNNIQSGWAVRTNVGGTKDKIKIVLDYIIQWRQYLLPRTFVLELNLKAHHSFCVQ